jgi:hypothetical protein
MHVLDMVRSRAKPKLGTPLKVGEVSRYVLRPICKKLGVPRGGMHAFRHGRVSKMQDEGVKRENHPA